MGCCFSKTEHRFPNDIMHLYSREGCMLYTLLYSNENEYLLMNSMSHDVIKLSRINDLCMGNDHIVIDGWVNPGWWISACWYFMFDNTHKCIMNNNFLINKHYLRVELSKMSLTAQHKKLGIEYLISIGTYNKDGDLIMIYKAMYGLR